MTEETRLQPRTLVRAAIHYSFDGGLALQRGATRDHSFSGLGLVVREKIPAGSLGVVWLPENDPDRSHLPVLCEVVSCRPFEVRGNFRIGLRVIHPAPEAETYKQRLERCLLVPEG